MTTYHKGFLDGLHRAMSMVAEYEQKHGKLPKVMPYSDKESQQEIKDQCAGIRIACTNIRIEIGKQIKTTEARVLPLPGG